MGFKILLIKPNICLRKGFDLQDKLCPPIGLAYLAGTLIEAGYEVEMLDMVATVNESWPYRETHLCYGLTNEGLIDRIRKYNPDLIGIGAFTSQYARVKEMVAAIKSFDPKIKIVLGGIHATAMPRGVLNGTKADFVIQGEGESGIVDLAEALGKDDLNKIKNIDGIAYREDGNVIVKPRLHFEYALDSIAWPARQLLEHERYTKDEVSMPVITSRSCPGRCTFCSVHILSGRKWRTRDPINIVDEIEDFVTKWGYKTVSIFDDACNIVPQRLIKICQEVINRKLKIKLTFPGGLVTRYITKDLLYWMKQAGAVSLTVPIEHANGYMRNSIIRKNLDSRKIFQVLNWCREFKLLALVNFVLGMPGETEESLQDIVTFVKENAHYIDALSVYIATPFPGTPFFNTSIEKGYLVEADKNDFLDFDTYTAHIDTPIMSRMMVAEYRKIIEQTFVATRGKHFPVGYIRKAIRKPNKETIDYINNVYFK